MTAMPQLVAAFNGFGGVGVGAGGRRRVVEADGDLRRPRRASPWRCRIAIGTVTFTGSFVAFGKLQGLISGPPARVSRADTSSTGCCWRAGRRRHLGRQRPMAGPGTGCWPVLASVLGVLAVVPIGGADMPVVISLLNSLSGLAAATAGFAIGNALIIGGALVGAAGLILTVQMTEAMNRSLANVLFAGFGGATAGSAADDRRPAGEPGDGRRRRDRPRVRRPGDHRARLRPGRRPGPARRAEAGRRPSRSGASRSTTRSTRWPAGCRAT